MRRTPDRCFSLIANIAIAKYDDFSGGNLIQPQTPRSSMKRIVLSLLLLSAMIVAGTLYAQQRRGRQPIAPVEPTYTLTLYEGGNTIKTYHPAVLKHQPDVDGDHLVIGSFREGMFRFRDTSGKYVALTGTVVIESDSDWSF